MIAALYIDPRGPYPKIPDVDCWDERRDARKYNGPYPVVAHPPCGPWGVLRHFCTKQDPKLGILAVKQVRKFGGVLEHPEFSLLFKTCGMPEPGWLPDQYGGRTITVDQVSWGHPCRKRTWLYTVRVPPAVVAAGIRTGGVATHTVTTVKSKVGRRLPELTKKWERAISPPAFAEWLVSLARSVSR